MSGSEGWRHTAVALASAALMALAPSAWAQGSTASREQELIRRLRLQVQQLQQAQMASQTELQQAQARSAALAQQLEESAATIRSARGERARALDAAVGEAQGLRQASAALTAERDALKLQLDGSARELQTLRATAVAQRERLAAGDTLAADLQARLRGQAEGLQTCIARNGELHALGLELLSRYENKGVWDSLRADEPFLQLGRVKLENLVRGYRERLDAQALAGRPALTRQATP